MKGVSARDLNNMMDDGYFDSRGLVKLCCRVILRVKQFKILGSFENRKTNLQVIQESPRKKIYLYFSWGKST